MATDQNIECGLEYIADGQTIIASHICQINQIACEWVNKTRAITLSVSLPPSLACLLAWSSAKYLLCIIVLGHIYYCWYKKSNVINERESKNSKENRWIADVWVCIRKLDFPFVMHVIYHKTTIRSIKATITC